MAVNKRLLQGPTAAGELVPSEHFGVALYEGDGKGGHSINGGKFGAGAAFGIEKSTTQATDSRINTTYYAKNVGSISGWFKKDGNTSELEYLFVTKNDTGSAHQLGINLLQEADSDLRAVVGNGSSTTSVSTSGLTLNNDAWHHFVVTWNLPNSTNNVKVYVNGSLSSTGSQTTGSWTGNSSRTFQLGHYTNTNTNNGFAGMQDQVRVFEKELSSSEVSTLYAETASTVESLDPLSEDTTDTLQVLGDTSCIATYRFENDEVDLSGNYNGTGTAIQYAAGRYGQSASFNGSSSFINPNGDWGVNGDSSHSVSFWVNFNSTADQHFYGIGDTVTAYTHTSLIIDSSLGRVYHDNNGNADILATSLGLSTGQWYHFVLTYNSSDDGLELYIDNVSKGTATRTLNVIGDAVIGRRPYYASNYLNADLDQFRVFNKELSASEVTTLYQENSLVASYRLDGNSNDDMRTYNGTDNDITYEFGLNFTPDFVWIKPRSFADNHVLSDSTRGVNKSLAPNTSSAEQTTLGVASFDTGGFTLPNWGNVNSSGNDFVAWCLKANGGTTSSNTDGNITSTVQANIDAGFSIITYTGTGGGSKTIGHGLGVEPSMYITKRLNSSDAWRVTAKVIEGYELDLSSTSAKFQDGAYPDYATSSVIKLGTGSAVNTSGGTYVTYCFANVDGFSKIGSYEGNGTTEGPMVETGFEPAFIIIKDVDGLDNWAMVDNKRATTNPRQTWLRANLANAEFSNTVDSINFYSNGFQIAGGTSVSNFLNESGHTFIYMAFAADPDTEAPTVARSFNVQAYDGTATSQTIENGFKTGLLWTKCRNVGHHWGAFDIVTGTRKYLTLNNTTAQNEGNPDGNFGVETFGDTSTTLYGGRGRSNSDYLSGEYVGYFWKADDNEATIEEVTEDLNAVAVYKFEDNGDDVTGSYDATSLENITYSSSGKFNKAIEFNGSNSAFRTTGTLGLTGNMDFGVSFWMNADSLSGDQFLWGSGVGGANYGQVGLMIRNNTTIYADNRGNTDPMTSSQSLSTGTWYHIVHTYSASAQTHYLYINGSYIGSVGTVPINITTNNGSTIGIRPVDDTYRFDGRIDQFRVYHATLTSSNVTTLYNETAAQNDNLSLGMTYVASLQSIVSANANAGFSIVKWTGAGGTSKVPHGLSAAPELIINKRLSGSNSWDFWVTGATAIGWDKYLGLNRTDAAADGFNNTPFGDTAPTSTVFTVDSDSGAGIGGSGDKFISYCFHSVAGYSKIGSYTGTGTTNSITGLGFQPDWLMIKRATGGSSNGWVICDSVRGVGINLRTDSSGTEADESAYTTSFDSDGFTLAQAGGNTNVSGSTYLYMAFKIN